MSDYNVVVIGAGCGGLCAGAQMANQGYKTLVLEQSHDTGGFCSAFEEDGYTFDTGASILELVEVTNICFERLGTSIREEVDLVPIDPLYSMILKDGSRMKHYRGKEPMAREIEKISPEDVNGWNKYVEKMQGFLNIALDGFFLSPGNTLVDVFKMYWNSPGLLKYSSMFFSSYQQIMAKYFKNPRVSEALSFQANFMGLPPENCPGHFTMLPWAEHAGMYYSKGGMSAVPKAIEKCGKARGMEVKTQAKVKKVMIRKNRAVGVILKDGTEISADVVISDINAITLYRNLIGEEHLSRLVKIGLGSYKASASCLMLYLGLDYEPPLESHHTLLTRPVDQLNEYHFQSLKQGQIPDEQFGLISWTTKSDPSLAPQGHHIVSMTLAGPYHLADSNWDDEKDRLKEKIINEMAIDVIPGLKDHVQYAKVGTPLDFERKFLAPEGAIYMLNQDLASSMMFRPSAKSKSIDGLYLVGASTHPGGGIPSTIASGIIASDLIQKYENL